MFVSDEYDEEDNALKLKSIDLASETPVSNYSCD